MSRRAVSEDLPRSPCVSILVQMGAWTEEAGAAPLPVENAASRPGAAREVLTVSGVPWVTFVFLLACGWVLVAAGGARGALSVSGLLAYGAKATPLILDRGETWRLLSANLLHKDLLHLAFNAFAIWNVGGALERAVRPSDYLALITKWAGLDGLDRFFAAPTGTADDAQERLLRLLGRTP